MELKYTIEQIKLTFSESDDLKCRSLNVAGTPCAFCFIDGGIDRELLEQSIIKPLKHAQSFEKPYKDSIEAIVSFSEDVQEIPVKSTPGVIAEGDIVMFVDGEDVGYMFSLRKPEKRAIGEPPSSSVLKGPREGFIEEIKTNLSLMRRRIKSPDLVVKTFQVGRYSSNTVDRKSVV